MQDHSAAPLKIPNVSNNNFKSAHEIAPLNRSDGQLITEIKVLQKDSCPEGELNVQQDDEVVL